MNAADSQDPSSRPLWNLVKSLFRWFYGSMAVLGFLFFLLLAATFVISIWVSRTQFQKASHANVAHIRLNGPIVALENEGSVFRHYGAVISGKVVNLLEELSDRRDLKAVLLEINSPGGTPVASAEIARAVRELKLPVVAWVREIAASGAYWVAAAADHIVAHPLSMTGSIGVQASSFGFEDVLTTLKIDYRRMVAGDFKDMGTPFREQTEKETAYLREVIDRIHASFVRAFAEYRNIPEERARELATGKIYIGETALEFGMVDQLGSRKEVMEWLREQVGEPVVLERIDGKKTFWNSLFQDVRATARGFSVGIGEGIARFWTRRTSLVRLSVSDV